MGGPRAPEYHDFICPVCGEAYRISHKVYLQRKRRGTKPGCTACLKSASRAKALAAKAAMKKEGAARRCHMPGCGKILPAGYYYYCPDCWKTLERPDIDAMQPHMRPKGWRWLAKEKDNYG